MPTDDFFRARIDQMIDLSHPLAVLARRMPWESLEKALAPTFANRDRKGRSVPGHDLFGPTLEVAGAGVEEILKASIDAAVQMKAIQPESFERVIVDSTVQPKAIAYPVDSRLLEIARGQLVKAAKDVGIALKQTFAREGGQLRRKVGGYAHARQFKRLHEVLKRQKTVLGRLIREAQRKLPKVLPESQHLMDRLETVLQRAQTLRNQPPKGSGKHLCDARSRGRVHLQGQGTTALRVRRQVQFCGHAPGRADRGDQDVCRQPI